MLANQRKHRIGEAMGNDAARYYPKLTRYLTDGSSLAWHAEYLQMVQAAILPQAVSQKNAAPFKTLQ